MKNKNLLIFGLLWAVLLAFNFVFPPQSDDIGHYFLATDKNFNFFTSYLEWNGRFGELIWSSFFAKLVNTPWFDLLNATIGSIFIFVFFALIFARLPRERLDYLSLGLICLMLVNMNFAAIFLWGSGSANYLWGIGLIVIFLIPYRLMWGIVLEQGEKSFFGLNFKEFLLAIGLFILAIPAGWASEHIGALVSFLLALSFIFAYVKKIKLPLWYFAGALGFWCGWLILFNSPGSAKRSLIFIENGSFLTLGMIWKMSFFEKLKLLRQTFNHFCSTGFNVFFAFFSCFYLYKMQIKLKIYQYFLLLLGFILSLVFAKYVSALVVFAGVFYLIWKMQKTLGRQYLIYFILFGIWSFIALILIQLKGSLPWRARFGNELILFVMIVLMFRDVYTQSHFKQRIEKILCIALAGSTLLCFANWTYVGYNWNKVEKIVQEKKNQGIDEIVVSIKYFKSFYNTDWDMPNEDPKWWLNSVYARYFGIKSFSVQ